MPADREELHRLRLEALGRVDEHHRGVDRGEHPVGVLGEVGVTGGVEQVDDGVAVGELQRGRGDGDAAVALHLHPVGDGAPAAGLAVHGAGLADHPRVQGQGLGERRLAGVGVADDREGAAPRGLAGGGALGVAAPGRAGCRLDGGPHVVVSLLGAGGCLLVVRGCRGVLDGVGPAAGPAAAPDGAAQVSIRRTDDRWPGFRRPHEYRRRRPAPAYPPGAARPPLSWGHHEKRRRSTVSRDSCSCRSR